MKESLLKYQRGWSLVLGLMCLVAWGGCGLKSTSRSTPPGPLLITGTGERGSYFFLRWKEGLTIMVCSDIRDCQEGQGGGTSDDPVYRAWRKVSAHDGRYFECQLESAVGRPVKFTLAGTEYELTKDTLFLVTTQGGETKVQKLDRDLSAVQPTIDGCSAFVAQEPEVSKLVAPFPRPPRSSATVAPNPRESLKADAPPEPVAPDPRKSPKCSSGNKYTHQGPESSDGLRRWGRME